MSILSKIKSGVKKVASLFTTGGNNKSSLAPPITAINPSVFTPQTSNKSQVSYGQTPAPRMSVIPNMSIAPTATLMGGVGRIVNGAPVVNNSPGATAAGVSYASQGQSPIYSAPITMKGGTSSSFPTQEESFAAFGGASNGGSISSASMSSSPAISIPSAPTVANPGVINNGGLQTNDYSIDPATNMIMGRDLTGDTSEAENSKEKKKTSYLDSLKDLIREKDNVYEDPDVIKQNEEVLRKKQEVANYTAQLNSVVAQQNADLLRLRGIGSAEGVTETVYGGQQATINREAAIKALPIQAQVAAAQGNLELAQDYLTQLTTWKREAIDNDHNYWKEVMGVVKPFLEKEEQREFDELEEEKDRTYTESQDLVSEQDYWIKEAVKNGQTTLIPKINNARTRQELATAVSGMTGTTGGVNNQTTDNERALMAQFRGEQIVKDYNEVLGQKGTIDAYIQNGVGGPADLALVFSFMKGLDPTSVVRESEYETAAKSGNIFQGVFAKFNGYFKAKGGFLPANVRQEFQNLVNQKLAVKQKQYENVKSQYEGIAKRQGLNTQNVVIDYAGGAMGGEQTTQSQDDPLGIKALLGQ